MVGMLWVFVGNCIIKRFSQRPITSPFYAKSCGCRCLNHQCFSAKLSILCLAVSNTEPQGSAIVLLLVWLSAGCRECQIMGCLIQREPWAPVCRITENLN